MFENSKISARQLMLLVILFNIGSAVIFMPSLLATEAKQDAWLSVLLAVGITLLVLPLYITLASRFPNMTLVEYSEELLGKWLGKTVSLLFLVGYIGLEASLTLNNIGAFMTSQIMQKTPIEAIYIFFLCIVIMGTRLGLEVFSRSVEVFFPLLVLLFVILVLFIIPQIEFKNVQPVLENGIKPVIRGSLDLIGFPLIGSVTFLMILPYVNQSGKSGKAFFAGILIAGAILFIITLLSILVLGADNSARQIYPSFALAKMINIGNFLQRVEVLIATFWFISTFFRLTILFFVLVLGLAQIVKLKDYRRITLPMGMIIMMFSLIMVPNYPSLFQFDKNILWIHSFILCFLLPVLLIVIAGFRKKGESI